RKIKVPSLVEGQTRFRRLGRCGCRGGRPGGGGGRCREHRRRSGSYWNLGGCSRQDSQTHEQCYRGKAHAEETNQRRKRPALVVKERSPSLRMECHWSYSTGIGLSGRTVSQHSALTMASAAATAKEVFQL